MPRAFSTRGTGPITVAEIDPAVTELAAEAFWFDPTSATILHEDGRRALLTRNKCCNPPKRRLRLRSFWAHSRLASGQHEDTGPKPPRRS
nr:fused MFS/spermidine synthase [Puniceibacterium sediminis]